MPSGLNAETLTKVMIGSAVLKVDGTVVGVSRGIRAEISTVIRSVPFDGKVADIAGLDRVVGYVTRVRGTFLQFSDADLERLEHGVASVAVGSVNVTTPIPPQQFFAVGNYLEDVTFEILQADGDLIHLDMSLGLVTYSVASGGTDDESTIDLAIESRLTQAEALGEEELELTTLTIAGPITVDEGDTITLTVTGEDQNSDPIDATGGEWTVVDGTGSATIDPDTGELTGVTAGTVTVTYTLDGVSDDYVVTVEAVAGEGFSDDFNRADGAIGAPWEILKGGVSYLVAGNQAKCDTVDTAVDNVIARESSLADGTFHIEFPTWNNGTKAVVRCTNKDNYISVGNGGSYWVVGKNVAGSYADTGSFYVVAPASGDYLDIVMLDEEIKVYLNGVLRITHAGEAFNKTATKHGWNPGLGDPRTTRVDNVSMVP